MGTADTSVSDLEIEVEGWGRVTMSTRGERREAKKAFRKMLRGIAGYWRIDADAGDEYPTGPGWTLVRGQPHDGGGGVALPVRRG